MLRLLTLLMIGCLCPPAIAGSLQGDMTELVALARRNEQPEVRMRALESIAELQPEVGPPRKAITTALAIGLEDESPLVREQAVLLLGLKQHPEVAVDKLVKGASSEFRRWRKAAKEFAGFNSSSEGKKLLKRMERENKQGVMRPVARTEYFGTRAALRAAEEALGKTLDAFSTQLGRWKDDRCVDALASMLDDLSSVKLGKSDDWALFTEHHEPMVKSLLALRSHKSLKAVTDALERWMTKAKTAKVKHEKEKDRSRKPNSGGFSSSMRYLNLTVFILSLCEELRAFGTENKLAKIPEAWGTKEAWRSWAATARAVVPEKLGRVAAPKKE